MEERVKGRRKRRKEKDEGKEGERERGKRYVEGT